MVLPRARLHFLSTVLFFLALLNASESQSEGDGAAPPGEGTPGTDQPSIEEPHGTEDLSVSHDHCGGILNATSGTIDYKMYVPYEGNERCLWTIHSPGSLRITFTLEANGLIQTMQDYLAVGYFAGANYHTASTYREIILKHNSPNNSLTIPGEIAFVRFFSDKTINGMGFLITYTSEMADYVYPHHYQNFHFNSDYGMIQYPPDEQHHMQPSERLTMVIKPRVPVTLALKYFNGICGKSRDHLTIYQRRSNYDRSAISIVQQLCSSPMDKIPMWKSTADSEIFITFQSNASKLTTHTDMDMTKLGFKFIWVPTT